MRGKQNPRRKEQGHGPEYPVYYAWINTAGWVRGTEELSGGYHLLGTVDCQPRVPLPSGYELFLFLAPGKLQLLIFFFLDKRKQLQGPAAAQQGSEPGRRKATGRAPFIASSPTHTSTSQPRPSGPPSCSPRFGGGGRGGRGLTKHHHHQSRLLQHHEPCPNSVVQCSGSISGCCCRNRAG